jgi:hypothetical protein
MCRPPHAPILLALLASLLLVGQASAAELRVRDRAGSGTLELTARSGEGRVSLAADGALRARRWLRLVALRCPDRRCRTLLGAGSKARAISPGRHVVRKRLRLGRAAGLRVQLRAGRRLIAQRRVVPKARELPVSSDPPSDPPPEAPAAFSIATDPPIGPTYDPAIPDYNVDCSADSSIRITAAVPRDQTLVLDGGPSRTGTEVDETITLQPNQGFRFTITDGSGTHEHGVRCLPADFPPMTFTREGTPQADLLAISPARTGTGEYAMFVDSNGVPIWWMKATGATPIDVKLLPDDTVAWGRNNGFGYSRTYYDNVTLDGIFVAPISAVGPGGTDAHELLVLPNGNRVVLVYPLREHVDLSSFGGQADAKVLDGEIQELRPDGTLEWSWNSNDYIALSETEDSWGVEPESRFPGHDGEIYDIVHMNSVEPDGDGFIFSARHLNAVYRINRDKTIDWKLGGSARPESLTIVGDPFAASRFGGQHDARRHPDGTVSVLDNGTTRGRPPSVVRYAIDPVAKTATLVEEVVDARASRSACCNSARILPGGNWVVTNDVERTISELTPSGDPVFTYQLAQGFTYRAIPYTSADVTRSQLRSGMDAMHPR